MYSYHPKDQVKEKVKMFGIKYMEVYGKVTCPYCAKTVDFLKAAGIEFILLLVDQAPSRLHEIKKLTNHATVPIILEHMENKEINFVGGYDNLVHHMKAKYGLVLKSEIEDDAGGDSEGEE